ncbi:MAG TPA: AAA family ATPase [Acidimicrobiales bacterium]|nr:AAA family ATPase [Acidimicrobiales bacterium]
MTILFTDIVGSTELSQGVSAEEADDIRRAHFSVLRQAIAEAGGSEVKNLGDGLMVVFSSAAGALSCAVSMQQGVEQFNRCHEHPVGLRVGLSAGEVNKENDDFFGDPVVEAARLCANCASGQVLAANIVKLMAGRRSRHAYRSLGELALKGLADPVETVELLWEPLTGTRSSTVAPLQSRLERRPTAGVVGRESEMEVINAALKRVAEGDGRQVLLISGEAGMGKTTLVAEAARSAFDTGALVLFGHCEEDLATPYRLFSEALGHYVTHAPEELLVAHVDTHGSELSRLVPALASRVPNLPVSKATDPDTERYLLFASVVGLLVSMSEDRPVVLVLDDLQWADPGSLALLRHLAASAQAMRVLVLGTYRDNELSRSHPLFDTLGALRRQSAVARIELAGLDDSGVVAFLEAAAGQTLDAAGVDLAHAVYRETDGNPFFVYEVLRHLSETGAIYQDASGRWTTDTTPEQIALPDSVREVIGSRIGRLGETAERVLSLASVIGRDFDLALLVKAADSTEDELVDILDAAKTVALVREDSDTPGQYSFAHSLVRHTLYDDLGPTRRARAHRQIADALEDLCGGHPGARVGELARHWTNAAQPIDLTKAIGYSRQAGDAALAALAPADALRYYSQALDHYSQAGDPDPLLALDLAIGLGTAQRQTGDPVFRDTLLDAARYAAGLGDTDRLMAAALANDRGWFSSLGVLDDDKIDVLQLTIDQLPDDNPDRALVRATLCSELTFGSPLERRQDLAGEALAIAQASGDDARIVRVSNHVALPLMVPALHEDSMERTSDAVVRAQRIGDPFLLFFAAHWRVLAAHRGCDLEEMNRSLEIQRTSAEQLDQPMVNWAYTFDVAVRALVAGDTDRAEQLATEALEIGTEGNEPDAGVIFSAQLVSVNFQRGTMDELVPVIEEMILEAPEISRAFTAVLALAHAEADRTKEAALLLEEFAAVDFQLPVDATWLIGMVCYAEAAIAVRDVKYAGPLFDRLIPWADQCSTTGATAEGPIAHYLGGLATALDRFDDADAYFRRSAEMSERMEAKFFGARTDLFWGQMLVQRDAPGDVDRASELLVKSQTLAVDNGYAVVERRAAEALGRLNR